MGRTGEKESTAAACIGFWGSTHPDGNSEEGEGPIACLKVCLGRRGLR